MVNPANPPIPALTAQILGSDAMKRALENRIYSDFQKLVRCLIDAPAARTVTAEQLLERFAVINRVTGNTMPGAIRNTMIDKMVAARVHERAA